MSDVIVAIDDEPHNLMLLEGYLDGSGHIVKPFADAAAALEYLRRGGAADTILLDRMMPGMDGMAFMQALNALEGRASLPVIMQTAAATPAEIAAGIAAGAYYYLTKPFSRDVLRAIVARALADHAFHRGLQQTVAQMTAAMRHMDRIRLSFRTLDDVRLISFFVATLFPDPGSAILGVTELMLNAVEHGNLGITYAEKGELNRRGTWQDEVERRLALPEHRGKLAWVELQREASALVLTIADAGAGFDWAAHVGFDRERARDSHGRGIAMSRMVSFDDVSFVAPGNMVVCRKQV